MYKIRGADQNEYGPVSAETVRQWIAQRRANAQTLVQAEGSTDWRPLSALPEFIDVLQAGAAPPPMPGPPRLSATGPSSSPVKTSGLAVASLVLGILGLFSCGTTSLVGLILGIVAVLKIRESKGQLGGNGLAIGGICVSAFIMIFGGAVGAGLLLPALAKAKGKATQINCVSRMKQIGLAVRMWSSDHNETFPPDLLSISNEVSNPMVLVCPSDTSHTPAADWAHFGPENVTYEFLTPGIKEVPATARTVILRCPIHNSIGYGDGSVQMGRGRGVGQ